MSIDKARDKHNELVKQLAKTQDAFQKAVDTLVRLELKRRTHIKAVTRSERRLQQLRKEERQAKRAPKAPVEPADLIL